MSSETDPKVDAILARETTWQPEMERLREIALGCGLTEVIRWGKPCYAVDGGNVVLIQGFKAYCALLFFKGVLIDDPDGLLVDVGANSRVGKQARFTSVAQIEENATALTLLIEQAIALERSGAKVERADPEQTPVPEEFQQRLDDDSALRDAFERMTPGRQREYLLYFSNAKQSKTRADRVEKSVPQILEGLGLRDA
jgi:uncharacterized protein YdeI (YjbR/CyaY-like superfamily)